MENQESQEITIKKQALKRYRKNYFCIRRLEEKMDLLTLKINSIKSSNFSAMPRGSTPVTIDDLLSDKMDLESRISRLKVKGKKLKREILEEIDELEDPRYCAVLEGFFIDCLSLEDIADIEGYTVRHVYRLYYEAIRLLSAKGQ